MTKKLMNSVSNEIYWISLSLRSLQLCWHFINYIENAFNVWTQKMLIPFPTPA